MSGFGSSRNNRAGLWAAMVAFVLVALAACGSQGGSSTNGGQSESQQSSVAPSAPAATAAIRPADLCKLLTQREVTSIGVPNTPKAGASSPFVGDSCVWGETDNTTLFLELHATCSPVPPDMMQYMDSKSTPIAGGPPNTRLWYVIESVPALYTHKGACYLSVSSANVPVPKLMTVFKAAYKRLQV